MSETHARQVLSFHNSLYCASVSSLLLLATIRNAPTFEVLTLILSRFSAETYAQRYAGMCKNNITV